MSSNNALNIAFETMQEINAAAIPATPNFAPIGDPLEFPARMSIISNFSNVTIFISIDNINPHIPLAATTSMVLDWSSNRSNQAGVATLPKGTQFYVSGGPGVGFVYVTSIYASDGRGG